MPLLPKRLHTLLLHARQSFHYSLRSYKTFPRCFPFLYFFLPFLVILTLTLILPPAPPPLHSPLQPPSLSPPKSLLLQDIVSQISGRASSRFFTPTVSLIAACKDRRESLTLSLPSWVALPEIHQIVLVDWASHSPIHHLPHVQKLRSSSRLVYVHVTNADKWVLSRAYNLAAKLATGAYMLKVDCDTHLTSSFFDLHPLPPPGHYYSLVSGTERDQNEEKLRGVWLASTADFRRVGGYDERISEYGYEDVDLYRRLTALQGNNPKPLILDSIRHNMAAHDIYPSNISEKSAPRISRRINQAVFEHATSWQSVIDSGLVTKYAYEYDSTTGTVHATIIADAMHAHHGKSVQTMHRMRMDVLHQTLHDEFSLPTSLINQLTLPDLQYLAAYMDVQKSRHVLVVSLEGYDVMTNLFNLISAIVLGITHGRPIIAIWHPPHGARLSTNPPHGLLQYLFHLINTNQRLKQAHQSDISRLHAFAGETKLISASSWACTEELIVCAEKDDDAYGDFAEIVMHSAKVYDERHPVPVRVGKHTFLRLGNVTRIGNAGMRAVAMRSLVPGELVTKWAQAAEENGVAVVAVGKEQEAARELVQTTVKSRGKLRVVSIIGEGAYEIRRESDGAFPGEEFCQKESCDERQAARELANVYAMIGAKHVFPEVGVWNGRMWKRRRNVSSMIVADLRATSTAGASRPGKGRRRGVR